MISHNRHSDRDYSNHTFEDFLQDDFFISSVTSPNEESSAFWEDTLRNKKINEKDFEEAKAFLIKSASDINNLVSDEDISSLWNNISVSITRNKLKAKQRIRKRLYIAIGVAAGIAAIFMSIPFLKPDTQKLQEKEFLTYVDNNYPVSLDSLTDIQLVLLVRFDHKESSIVYDSAEIIISDKETIRKEPKSAAYHQLMVPKGRRSTLRLSDGTFLYVNSGTIVSYPVEFTEKTRTIYINGEAYLDVHHDTHHPFVVKTSQVDIQVLGTQFNVMAYDDDDNKQITLAEGSVKILSNDKDNGKGIILKPSEMYQYNNGKTNISKVDLIKYTSWKDGIYYFDSERLDAIMKRLSRYYGTSITFDDRIASLKCSGKMDLKDDLTDVLNGLAFSFPIKINNENENYHITRKQM
ncbi:MAG: FecR domain-containing protein [Prevotella sp.]|jgi:hypothetical protein|nr:FecR domain-containing protein [Prevotella sp.]